MHHTMLKSKIHRAPCVVHVGAHNETIQIDREVANLLGEPTVAKKERI